MAMRLASGLPDNYVFPVGTVTAGVAIAEGDILAINGNVLERATSSSTIHTVVGVAAETITTAATSIKFVPFVQGQLWIVDVANNTATDQLYESMALTDHDTVNNSGTDVSGATGVFTPFAVTGAAADRKLLGEFTRLQSTST